MSGWRKRQIEDIEADANEQTYMQEPSSFLQSDTIDYILLFAGTGICTIAFGITGGLGIAILAIYAKGK